MTHMSDDALDPFLFKCHLVETRMIPLKQFMWKSGTERHLAVCSQTFAPTTSMNVSFWPIKTIVDFRTSAPCRRQVSLISAAWPCTDDKSSDGHGSFTVPPACCRAGKKETSSFEFRVPTPSKKKMRLPAQSARSKWPSGGSKPTSTGSYWYDILFFKKRNSNCVKWCKDFSFSVREINNAIRLLSSSVHRVGKLNVSSLK